MKTKYKVLIALAIIAILGLIRFPGLVVQVSEDILESIMVSLLAILKTGDVEEHHETIKDVYGELEKYMKKDKEIYARMDVPVYYINMDRSIKRREFMESQSRLFQVPSCTRVEGVAGNHLDSLASGRCKDLSYTNEFSEMSPPELGCTLSHLKAIRTAYQEDRELALILEDDAVFSLIPFWETKLSQVASNAPKDWEIIQLFTLGGELGGKEIFTQYDIQKPRFGATAYMINRRGMRKILETVTDHDGGFKIERYYSPKGTADQFIYALVKTYHTNRPLFVSADHVLKSTIHEHHESQHVSRSNEVVRLYQKYNISSIPLNQHQLRFGKTLHDMANLLDISKVPYRLSNGTLLGAYRENAFISYDGDIDLEILSRHYKPQIENGNDFFQLSHRRGRPEKGYELTFRHLETGIDVDLFFVYDEKDYRWFASYEGRCDFAKNGMCRHKIPKCDTTTISFMGRDFPMSQCPEEYLRGIYGPNWNIPRNYDYLESQTSYNYSTIEQDFHEQDRIDPPKESQEFNLWPRKIAEMKKPIIWLYWQNKTKDSVKPPYLDLCLETVNKNCGDSFEIIVLNDKTIPVVSRTIDPNFVNIEPLAMRADYLRFCLIHEYGGVWLDCDTVVLKDLSFMIEDLKNHNFVAFEHDPNEISIGIMAGNKGNRYSRYMKLLFEKHPSYSKWKKGKRKIEWAEPTNTAKSFLKGLRTFYPREVKMYPAKIVYPVHWRESKKYYCSVGKLDPLIVVLPAVYLHNQMYDNEFKTLSKSEILDGSYRMSELLRTALHTRYEALSHKDVMEGQRLVSDLFRAANISV